MIQLGSCTRCGGFLALALRACPHCDEKIPTVSRVVMGAATLLGGSAVSMTLMACYGPACANEVCDDGDYVPSGSHTITASEVQRMQEAIAAGTWTGMDADLADCNVIAEGATTPRRLSLTVEGANGSVRVELEQDVTQIEDVSAGALVTYRLGDGREVTVEGASGVPRQVSIDSAVCRDLKRP